MGSLLKHGTAEKLKIKSSVSAWLALMLLTTWVFPSLACTRSVIQPRDLTATALISQPENNVSVVTTPSLEIAASSPTSEQSGNSEQLSQIPVVSEPTFFPSSSPTFTPQPSPTRDLTPRPPILYYSQAGDTLRALAARFGVDPSEITSPENLPAEGVLTPNQLIIIPDVLPETGPGENIIPDSEVVFSPSAVDFDIHAFVSESNGHLAAYREWLSNGWNSGADVIQRVAIENSINPRLLLSILEYQSHWVYGSPANLAQTDYPMGNIDFNHSGLYKQLSWAVQQLSIGYYGWRAGILNEVSFPIERGAPTLHFSPKLNAGSVALQYLFAQLYDQRQWGGVLYAPESLPALHEQMFGDPWLRAQSVEPLYPPTLTQPVLELPFKKGRTWSLTGGPHSAWGPDGALSALDFAPSSMDSGCVQSDDWVTASASGKVAREGNGVVVLDLDGDGFEQTGWALLYLHISTKDRLPIGSWVNTDDLLGHPSCEGGSATGTHVHIARKYNGEWILADGAIPFNLSGWQAHAGDQPYEGLLTKGNQVVEACSCGSAATLVTRLNDIQ